MKYKNIIIAFLFIIHGSMIQAQTIKIDKKKEEGYLNPVELLKDFLMPLKNGQSGLQDSMKVSNNMLNSDSNKFAQGQLKQQGTEKEDSLNHQNIESLLANDLSNNTTLSSVKLLDKDTSKLNGSVQTYTYKVIYSNEKTRNLTFKLLKPTINGGYFIIGIDAD
jgi:hypothetical protein